jgi:hypothetical protein
MTAALFVHPFEIAVAQKADASRETALLASSINTGVRVSLGGYGVHGLSFRIAGAARVATEAPSASLRAGPRHTRLLFAESWFYGDPLAPLGATAGKNFLAALGLHARAKSVLLGSLAPVGLECTLGHEKWTLLIWSTVLRQTMSINEAAQ